MADDKVVLLEESVDRLVQACRSAGFEAHMVFSQSANELISFAYAHRIAATELLDICTALIEYLNVLEQEVYGSRKSELH